MNLCEKCQFDEFSGWPDGEDPITTNKNETQVSTAHTADTSKTSRNGWPPKKRSQQRCPLLMEAVAILKAWFFWLDHVAHPYPVLLEKVWPG